MDNMEYQQRVIDEHHDLLVKIGKLESFTTGGGTFEGLSSPEHTLLLLQLGHMQAYAAVLALRITRFG